MKTIQFGLIGLFLLFGGSSQAQELKYGAEIGVDISKPQFSDYSTSKGCYCGTWANSDYYAMPSANINGYIELKVNNLWGISSEPGFIVKDGYLSPTYPQKKSEKMYVYNNYIQIPVLLNFYIKDKLFFSIGPELAFFTNSVIHKQSNEIFGYPYGINTFEVSGLIGAGYSINDHIDLGLRYSHGLTDIIQSPPKIQYGNLYNQYLQLFVRYKK